MRSRDLYILVPGLSFEYLLRIAADYWCALTGLIKQTRRVNWIWGVVSVPSLIYITIFQTVGYEFNCEAMTTR